MVINVLCITAFTKHKFQSFLYYINLIKRHGVIAINLNRCLKLIYIVEMFRETNDVYKADIIDINMEYSSVLCLKIV